MKENEGECEDHFLPQPCVMDPCCFWVGGLEPICESRKEVKCEDLITFQRCNQMPCDCHWILDEGFGQCEQIEELGPFHGRLQETRKEDTAPQNLEEDFRTIQLSLKRDPEWPKLKDYVKPVCFAVAFFALTAAMTLQIIPLIAGGGRESSARVRREIPPPAATNWQMQSQDALVDHAFFDQ